MIYIYRRNEFETTKDVFDIVVKVQIPKGLFSSCLNVSVFDWRCHQIQWLVIQAAQVRRIFLKRKSWVWSETNVANKIVPSFKMKIVAIHWMTKRDVGDFSKKHDGWTHHHECLLWGNRSLHIRVFQKERWIDIQEPFPALTDSS